MIDARLHSSRKAVVHMPPVVGRDIARIGAACLDCIDQA